MSAVRSFPGFNRRLWQVLIVVLMVASGFALRMLISDSSGVRSVMSQWLPWLKGTPVTLYFGDDQFLIPISQTLSGDKVSPQTLVEALVAGSAANTGLISLIPTETKILDVSVTDGVAKVNLSADFLKGNDRQAELALSWSLLSWPGIDQVQILVEGKPITSPSKDSAPLFLVHNGKLIAVPNAANTPRVQLNAYLSSTSSPDVVGLPPDVRLVSYDFNSVNGLLSLNFNYTQALRDYAVENPDAMRLVLTGLIATMTHFPEVKAVKLDFDGHSQLGLGQCANLLRAPQTQPTVLNDVRLLGG